MLRTVGSPGPRYGLAVVRGASMEPTLRDGDRLVLRHGARPDVGDIVVFRFPDGEVSVKRVELVEADGIMVTRDNPTQGRDSWTLGGVVIPHAEVIGVVRMRLWPRPGRMG